MHMPQRPILVSFCGEAVGGARRVWLVPRASVGAGVQHADVDPAWDGRRIRGRKIALLRPHGVAAPVQRDVKRFEQKSFWLRIGKDAHVAGQQQIARDLAGRIMIAPGDEHGNAGVAKPLHLTDEKQARIVVAPISVVEVSRDHDEGNALVQRQVGQVFQRAPRGVAQPLGRRAIVAFQAKQRAIEMNVGGMNK
ncbi:MAG: hypothetical protein BWZ10_02837 [candidate division BRC1 bacterium ADurb.BinA364]|nr:MAG: hypothetical protein BWZ10_02837 [candidate division BRC1 bacterium ADurb.BinA364]